MPDRRSLLLEKAEQLFAESGFEGTSVRNLASAAGVNVAMISYYFGSKEKLFEALVEYRTSFLREKTSSLNSTAADPWQRLEAIVSLHVDRFFAAPLFHRILYREASLNSRLELQRIISDALLFHVHDLRRTLQDGMERGFFREIDVDLTIVSINGTIAQLTGASPMMYQRLLGQTSAEGNTGLQFRERLINHLLSMLSAHISLQKG